MTATAETKQVHLIPIADITVKQQRQRKEMGDLESLALSILKWGLIQPIVLDRNNVLVAGERRLEAHKMNGATHIEARYRDELTESDLEEIELEENIRRKQLTWQEEQKAIARIHQLKSKADPNWSQQQTAVMIQKPGQEMPQQRDVSEAVTLDKMMKLFPEIAGAKSKAQAINMARAKAKAVTRTLEVKANPEVYAEIESKVWLGDCTELIKNIPDASVDLILTDPPFGIDYDDKVIGTVGQANSYEDDTKQYMRFLEMAPEMFRVLKPDGWLFWFLGISWYEHVKRTFRKAGFSVDECPVIWDRSEGKCFTLHPEHYFTKAYDIALHCFKGDPHLVQRSKPNIIRVKPVEAGEREMVVERPVELYAEIIRRTTIPGQMVVDLFAGTGSCSAAAASLKRDFIAIEKDPERHAVAMQKIKAHIPT